MVKNLDGPLQGSATWTSSPGLPGKETLVPGLVSLLRPDCADALLRFSG